MYRYGIRHGRVPLPEIDSEISEALPITYADKKKASGVGVVLVLGGVELVDRIVVLPGLGDLGGWRIFERIGRCVAIPNKGFGENIRLPTQRSGSCM